MAVTTPPRRTPARSGSVPRICKSSAWRRATIPERTSSGWPSSRPPTDSPRKRLISSALGNRRSREVSGRTAAPPRDAAPERFASRRAPLEERALFMARRPRVARPASEQDELVRKNRPLRLGHDRAEILLDFFRIIALRQLEAAAHAADVRVDEDSVFGGRPWPAVREYHVGGLAPDPWQGHEVFDAPRNLAAELVDKRARNRDDRFRFLPVEARRVDDPLHFGGVGGSECARIGEAREELRRDAVYRRIGALRGKNRRDEQLERGAIHERGPRARIRCVERAQDRTDPSLGVVRGKLSPALHPATSRRIARLPARAPSVSPRATRHVPCSA